MGIPGKCCNAMTGHLVTTLWISFSASLAVLRPFDKKTTIANKTCLASYAAKLAVSINLKLKEYQRFQNYPCRFPLFDKK